VQVSVAPLVAATLIKSAFRRPNKDKRIVIKGDQVSVVVGDEIEGDQESVVVDDDGTGVPDE
jgi:hypothetical protein